MVEWMNISAKCPNKSCNAIFKFSQGKFPVVNDEGGWRLACKSCNHQFVIHVMNPNDLSYIQDNVELLDTNDGIVSETKSWAVSLGLSIAPIDSFIYVKEELKPIKYSEDEFPLYVTVDGENLEKIAYQALSLVLKEVDKNNNAYFNYFVKGRGGDPKFAYVTLDFKSNKKEHTAIFYYNFNKKSGKIPSDVHEILLLHITDSVSLQSLIDGVYSRDMCLAYLNKLLIRWRGLHKHVLIIVPFVGYLNQKAETRISLWEDLKKIMIDPNTYFLTRHIAKSLLEKSEEKLGLPTELLKEFDVESEAFDTMKLFNLFHAKFFAGVSDDQSEVLKGSFNIQKNAFFENLDYSLKDTAFFKDRYLKPLRIDLVDKEKIDGRLLINLRGSESTADILYQVANGQQLIDLLLKQ